MRSRTPRAGRSTGGTYENGSTDSLGQWAEVSTASYVNISRCRDFERELFNATAEVPSTGVVTIVVGDRPGEPFLQDVSHLTRLRRVEFRATRPEVAEQWMRMLQRAAGGAQHG